VHGRRYLVFGVLEDRVVVVGVEHHDGDVQLTGAGRRFSGVDGRHSQTMFRRSLTVQRRRRRQHHPYLHAPMQSVREATVCSA